MYISYYMRRDLKRLGLVLLLIAAAVWVWFQLNERMLPALARAEALCEEKPALTRATLDSIPPRWWWHPERRARHSLFYSKALDRELVDITSDSLILPAVEYYSLRGPDHYAMLSYYYAGRVEQNSGRTARAYAYFTFADRLADSLGDYHTGGLIARGLAEIHNYTNDFASELRYAQKAYDLFTRAGSSLHANSIHYNLANALYNNKQYEEAVSNYDLFIQFAAERGDTLAIGSAISDQASAYLSLQEPEKAKDLLEQSVKLYGFKSNVEWFADYACACAYTGEIEKALYYIDKACENVTDDYSKAKVYHRKSQIDSKRGAHKEAYEANKIVSIVLDSIINKTLQQPVVSRQSSIYRELAERKGKVLRTRTQLYISSVFVLILILGVLVAFYKIKEYRRQKESNDYMEQVALLQDLLRSMKTEIGYRIQLHFRERFDQIDRLGSRYFDSLGSANEKERIYNRVKSELDEMGSIGYTAKYFEPVINECMDNLMQRVRTAMPNLRPADLQLLTYLLMGLSPQTISVLLQTKLDATYMRTSRLKQKLLQSNTPEADQIIAILSKKNGK